MLTTAFFTSGYSSVFLDSSGLNNFYLVSTVGTAAFLMTTIGGDLVETMDCEWICGILLTKVARTASKEACTGFVGDGDESRLRMFLGS